MSKEEEIRMFTQLMGEIAKALIGSDPKPAISPALESRKSHSFVVGKSYLIRTVTMHYTGRLIEITDSDIVLEQAAWIADTGRYTNSLKDGNLLEVEPYPDRVAVNRDVIVDFAEWKHKLPRDQK